MSHPIVQCRITYSQLSSEKATWTNGILPVVNILIWQAWDFRPIILCSGEFLYFGFWKRHEWNSSSSDTTCWSFRAFTLELQWISKSYNNWNENNQRTKNPEQSPRTGRTISRNQNLERKIYFTLLITMNQIQRKI